MDTNGKDGRNDWMEWIEGNAVEAFISPLSQTSI